jgi:hypothetical protein
VNRFEVGVSHQRPDCSLADGFLCTHQLPLVGVQLDGLVKELVGQVEPALLPARHEQDVERVVVGRDPLDQHLLV